MANIKYASRICSTFAIGFINKDTYAVIKVKKYYIYCGRFRFDIGL